MTVYFAANEIEFLPNSVGVSVSTSSDILRTGVRACVRVQSDAFIQPFASSDSHYVDGTVLGTLTEGWVHARVKASTTSWSTGTGTFFGISNGAVTQNRAAFASRTPGVYAYFGPVDGTNPTNANNLVFLNVSNSTNVMELDIHFKIHATDGFIRWYVNGDVKRSISGNTLFTSGTQGATALVLADITSASTAFTEFSELLCSDEPTLNAKVLTVPLDEFDTDVNDWNGNLSDVNGTALTSDTINSDTVGDQFLASLDTVAGFDSALNVTGLVLSSAAYKDPESGVTSLAPLLEVNSTLYDSFTQVPLDNVIAARQYVFSVNPDTSAAWTESDVNALLIGYESGDD